MDTAGFLQTLRSAGVRLWLEDGAVRLRGGQGLDAALRAEMTARRVELLAYLQRDAGPVPRGPEHRLEAPLSFAQKRLWFLENWHGKSALYNEAALLRLDGVLDKAALARALEGVIARHEVLRTTYHDRAGVPIQRVHPAGPLDLSCVDLAADSGQLDAEVRDQIARPFDLAIGPMVRAKLYRTGEAEHHLCLLMHHIACDGWSSGVLVTELSALYAAFSAGCPDPLPPLPIQYADFACWQALPARRADESADLDWWQDRLAGAPERISLPVDRPRADDSIAGAAVDFSVPPDLADQVAAMARSQRATPYMVFLAAFYALLHRLGGNEDMVIGGAIANRDRVEVEPLVGFFVNTLALRADFSGNPSFATALGRVVDVAHGAFAHQALPFDRLITRLVPERAKAHAPLFQVMFSLQNAPAGAVDLAGIRVSRLPLPCRTSKFDLTLFLRPAGGGYAGRFEYRTALFDHPTIQRMGQLYLRLLRAALAAPDLPVSQLSMLEGVEAARLYQAGTGQTTGYPRDQTIPAVFAAMARLHPDAVAIGAGDTRLDYRGLQQQAACFAGALVAAGVRPGDRVALALGRSIPMVVASLGTLLAGAVYVPLDLDHPADRIAAIIAHCGARVAVGPIAISAVPVLGYGPMLTAAPLPDLPKTGPLDPAYIMYTSGSTGQPKGVVVPHRAILRLVCGQDYAAFGPGRRIGGVSNPAFDAASFEIWGALLTGARLDLIDREVLLSPPALAEALQSLRIDSLFLTVALFNRMAEDCPDAFGGLDSLLVGGEALSAQHVRRVLASARPPRRLSNAYGPTECATFAAVGPLAMTDDVQMRVPLGAAIANTSVLVLDALLRPCPEGVPGEIYIGGDALALGYHDNPAQTAQGFKTNPFGEGRLYRTGDLALWRGDGRIDLIGRSDDLVKLRGFRIEPGEVAAVLKSHPCVKNALVMARSDGGEQRLVGYVIPQLADTATDSLTSWTELFDTTYAPPVGAALADPFDGWISSTTNAPIPLAEMQEWQASTLAELRGPKGRSILEIGAGTGLLLASLAPDAARYVATDISRAAVERLANRRAARPDLAHVRLLQQPAHEMGGLDGQRFDLIILNSVVQYFPDARYLLQVLRALVPHLNAGGRIYLGDIRNLDLLREFHLWVGMAKLGVSGDAKGLADAVSVAMADESELALSPNLFRRIEAFVPGLACQRVALKRGRGRNEMALFRFSAELTAGPVSPRSVIWQDWRDGCPDLAGIATLLGQGQGKGELALAAIPNARVFEAIGQVQRALDPEALHALASSAGSALHLTFAQDARAMDALFTRAETALALGPEPLGAADLGRLANSPGLARIARPLRASLRAHVRRLLPDYMVPAAIVMLAEFPLTSNGKVARGMLPVPNSVDLHLVEAKAIMPPQTAAEITIHAIWAEVLGISGFGTGDRFFDLGGHSLLATQVVSRMKDRLGFAPSLRAFFDAPTIAALAATYDTSADQEVILI